MAQFGLDAESILLVALVVAAAFALFSSAIGRSVITLPIVFTVAGFLLSGSVADVPDPEMAQEIGKLVAEITLVLVLFSDASHIRLRELRGFAVIPTRMLLIGMPLTVGLGTLVVHLVLPEIGWPMAMLLAALLTPTDAALGQTVVSSPNVSRHLSQSINVESDLNDGLALPFVLFAAIWASQGVTGEGVAELRDMAAMQVVLGPIAGAAVGALAARLLDLARDRGWDDTSAEGVVFLATAFIAYLVSVKIGGNGFIAAFVGGAAFGNVHKGPVHFISEFMEGAGIMLTMAAFLLFGAFLMPDGLAFMSWRAVAVAALFLTAIRMLPIWLSLLGVPISLPEKLFLGWFGPRGLASILFTLIMVDEYELPLESELVSSVSMTVLLSILLHGITAMPLAQWIGSAAGKPASA